jgi:hypothetical protein
MKKNAPLMFKAPVEITKSLLISLKSLRPAGFPPNVTARLTLKACSANIFGQASFKSKNQAPQE